MTADTRQQEWTIATHNAQEREILIAHLVEVGFDGFEENEYSLKAYGFTGTISEAEARRVLEGLEVSISDVAPQNWNALWESSFEPVEIGMFCRIRAHFHAPEKGFQHEICITPKMSFGTGHHATTRMMVMMMEVLDFKGKKVLDFGAGTGVLAILAERLGAEAVIAIENDGGAVENAQENAKANNCQRLRIEEDSLEKTEGESFDVILANINRNILLHYADGLAEKLNPGGSLLLSGILVEDEPLLREAFEGRKLLLSVALHEGNWACLRFEKDNLYLRSSAVRSQKGAKRQFFVL